jgi:phenylacetate-CoA ligase
MTFDPLETFKSAVDRVPAYRDFLLQERGSIPRVETLDDFRSLPLTDKGNYLKHHPLERLCLDGDLRCAHVICRSSGSTSKPFYWPQLPEQERDLVGWVSSELEDTFSISTTPTLAIVALALGDWISGELATWSLRNLAMEQRNLTLVTPGMDREEVVQLLGTFSPRFAQTIVYGYPPHLKNTLETALAAGIPLHDFHVRLRLAGEGYSEKYRDHVNALLGYEPGNIFSISSGYASTDFGRVGKETPLSVTMRRLLHELQLGPQVLGCDTLPSVCQFNPAGFYLECVSGDLTITKHQAIPLVRYRSGDLGEILSFDEMLSRFRAAGIDPLEELHRRGGDPAAVRPLPFVLVHGRADGGVTFYGVNILVAQIREHFTGNFQIRKAQDENLDPVLQLLIEERVPGADVPSLPAAMARALASRSSEYSTLLGQQGAKLFPVVIPVTRDHFLRNPKIRYVDRGDPSGGDGGRP